ncbi:hypothetical protein TBR22_A16890 [Luteitalea sp. TBR-22]|uniref:hypothetical protein n=1 Tax=Luteitalea sp. TBR-22 TaxID=2802971 RepID=UPI001AFA8C3D|nr:hypothetical protein [Luteitalea sp. TBR-22]BCS32474.1 hypothetical protein TBR22_A16890 [Luteitalea sp. TBR-22]
MTRHLTTRSTDVGPVVEHELARTGGLLRLAPCWVPRRFVRPGQRLKLHPDDLYAFGLDRGGIDERWLGSTVEAMNPGRRDDEGLSYAVIGDERLLLRDAVAECGAVLVGEATWQRYGRWPVFSKFFDNQGPIPHHLHQDAAQAARVGREAKPEGYYFPAQMNLRANDFPYTFFGLAPGTTKADVRRCLERWHDGDNGILDFSQASRLELGTGWLVPPRMLHAPGSLCTYEPQWASDVKSMYQSLVDGQAVPRDLLVQDVPPEHHDDLDYLVEQLDWELNLDPTFRERHLLRPRVAREGTGFVDRWVVYGRFLEGDLFSAKELSLEPGATCTVRDASAWTLVCVQGTGTINGEPISSPSMLRVNELSDDEWFCSESGARQGVTFTNTSRTEPLVTLRCFGPGGQATFDV